ncbi:unnamed protein product [Rangifer tarandus platyrhynchus]
MAGAAHRRLLTWPNAPYAQACFRRLVYMGTSKRRRAAEGPGLGSSQGARAPWRPERGQSAAGPQGLAPCDPRHSARGARTRAALCSQMNPDVRTQASPGLSRPRCPLAPHPRVGSLGAGSRVGASA